MSACANSTVNGRIIAVAAADFSLVTDISILLLGLFSCQAREVDMIGL
jgi:hypothetical protein